MEQRGKLIVIDGLDGAGKTTQADKLYDRLIAIGLPAARVKFPRYESFTGKTLKRYLLGELGPAMEQSPYLVSLLFAADRWGSKDELKRLLANGTTVILDRYISSNYCFQAARMAPKERAALRSWLDELEYEFFGLPRADSFIFLSITASLADTLIAKRGGTREAYEKDRAFTQRVAKEYEQLCKTDPVATKVDCSRKGELLTIDEIHERIWKELQPIVTPTEAA